MTEKLRQKKNLRKTMTRSNGDKIMIVTGLLIVSLFLIIGFTSIDLNFGETKPKNRGPVKDPKKTGLLEQNSSAQSPIVFDSNDYDPFYKKDSNVRDLVKMNLLKFS